MLTVHHLRVSQSDRIVWLCEELGLPYELVLYQRDPVTRAATDDYRRLHPSGTAPVITDGALVLTEIGAIVEYLLAREGSWRVGGDAGLSAISDGQQYSRASAALSVPAGHGCRST